MKNHNGLSPICNTDAAKTYDMTVVRGCNVLSKTWDKIELNSSYGFPPVPYLPMEYDENKSRQITEKGVENLMSIQEMLKNIL